MSALPRGPKSAFLQLFSMGIKEPLAGLEKVARQYSDPMTIPMIGQPPFVLTWDPEGIKTIFTEDPDTYRSALNEAAALVAGYGSLFLLEGSAHKSARKMLAPPFHGERMRAYGALMRDATLRWTERWEVGRRFPVLDTTQAITLDVIIEAIFGVRAGERTDRFHKEIVDTLASFSPLIMFKPLQREFFGMGPWSRFKRHYNAIRDMVAEDVAEKRVTPGEDILSLLVAMRDEAGKGLSDQGILDHLFTMVMAGHETTASSLAYALYFLHLHPETLERLREELKPLGRDLDPAAVTKLPYLEAVIQETLRLRPVLPLVTRKLGRPLTLKGYELPEGIIVGAAVWLAHHREEVFPDPTAFKPERFLGKTYSPFEFAPFGGGARRCLGAAFAMYEMKIVLATLVARHRMKLEEPKPVAHELRAASFGPKGGIRMALEERL